MRPIPLIRSAAFRRTLLYVAALGAVTAITLGILYHNASAVVGAQTEATIEAEVRGLAEHYTEFGLPQLLRVIEARMRGDPGRRGIYLIADPEYAPLAGNLSAWPDEARDADGWITFTIAREEDGRALTQTALARAYGLRGGLHLLVGRDLAERSSVETLILESLLWTALAIGGIGLAGGLLMSRAILRRIDALGRAGRAILEGDLKRRMPVSIAGDEFDRLSESLNAMLDRIESLMAGMRDVADAIAHDLRSPISRLRGRLERALSETGDANGAARAAIEESLRETDQILATFQAVLDISLAESGALREEFATLDLSALVADAAELYQPLAEDKGLAFDLHAEGELPARGHRHLLSQAVANLIDNAVKYTEAGGAVHVIARRGPAGPEIVVADGGPGIPAGQRERALQRFTRLDASRSKPGNGLGLALVAAVARLHEGELTLEDNAPGLRVVLRLPNGGGGRGGGHGA